MVDQILATPAYGLARAPGSSPNARYRLGVMGGTFDPIHHGHLVAASEVASHFRLDEVVFVPTGQPWQKTQRDVSAAEDRYLMTVIATASNPRFTVSRVDIDRPGLTYTVDTLRELRAERGDDVDLFFITGADALAQILSWRDVTELFELAHFVGCTRPGVELDSPAIASLPAERITLDGGAGVGHLVDGLPGTGTGWPSDLVPGAGRNRAVHHQARSLCAPTMTEDRAIDKAMETRLTATEHALGLTRIAADAAADKLGTDLVAYDVSDQLAITDVFLVVTAANERQVGAVVDGIEEALRGQDARPVRREGDREQRWVLLDYLDVVVHVQHTDERQFYALERLWHDCPRISLGVDERR